MDAVTRILFVGNSFTFVNDLPHQLMNVAKSLGSAVEVANSTIGGCNLYHQVPERDERTALLLQQKWDFIVLQDYSAMATVYEGRAKYMEPAVADFAAAKKSAQLVLYLTWGYHDGNAHEACPSSDNKDCFSLGTLADLTEPLCTTNSHYHNMTRSFECMGYSVARGYLSTMAAVRPGVSMVAPCGLAWQIVRGSTEIPSDCKALTDALYPRPLRLDLPLRAPNGTLPGFMLYRTLNDTGIDKHPNVAGQYLNALVMYATLLRRSPVGAADPLPTGSAAAGDKPLTPSEKAALQNAAESAVRGCGRECGIVPPVQLGSASTNATSLSSES